MKMRSERFPSLALAFLLSIGAAVAWGVLCGWGLSIIDDMISSSDRGEELQFLRDGTPILVSYAGRDSSCRTCRTLDGKELEDSDTYQAHQENLAGPDYRDTRFDGLRWRQRMTCVTENWQRREAWYFVHDGRLDGHGYLVGYDRIAKAKVGYIGAAGFDRDEPPLDRQFPVSGLRMSSPYTYRGASMIASYSYSSGEERYLLADDGLWAIDLKKRSVTILRKGTDFVSAEMSMMPQSPAEQAKSKREWIWITLLRTSDRIIALDNRDNKMKEIADYPLPPELRRIDLRCYVLADRQLIVQDENSPHELYWLAPGGKVVRRQHVDFRDSARRGEIPNSVKQPLTFPCPAPFAAIFVCYPWGPAEGRDASSLSYSAALKRAVGKEWPTLLAAGLVGVVLACVCYRRQRRYGLPWTGVWTVFVLLFGLPGYFGYLAHRAWPVRLPCPHCGQQVPRDRPACFACHRDFPRPAAKGIEVFA
jgi:hypothetical protein